MAVTEIKVGEVRGLVWKWERRPFLLVAQRYGRGSQRSHLVASAGIGPHSIEVRAWPKHCSMTVRLRPFRCTWGVEWEQ